MGRRINVYICLNLHREHNKSGDLYVSGETEWIRQRWEQDFSIHLFFLILFIFDYTGSSLLCRLFSSSGEWGLFFLGVCGLLIMVASLFGEHQLQNTGSIIVAHGLGCSAVCRIFPDRGI